MSDEVKKLQIEIDLKKTGSGGQEATAEMDALTNSGKGLATAVPDLSKVTQDFTIKTEAEYVAVVKAHQAMTAKIAVMSAAGKETAELVAAQANLERALESESALNVARNMEGKLWLEQTLANVAAQEEAAAAARKTATAAEDAAGGLHANSTAMREMTVIARELGRGNFSRIPGSVSILAQSFGMLDALLNPVTIGLAGVAAVSYLVYEHIANINPAIAALQENFFRLNEALRGAEDVADENKALDEMAGRADDAAGSTERLVTASKELADATDASNTSLHQQITLINQEAKAQEAAAIARVKAKLALGEITPGQAAQQERDIKGQGSKAADAAASKAEQDDIDAKKVELAKQKVLADKAKEDQFNHPNAVPDAEENAGKAKAEWETAQKTAKEQNDSITKENIAQWTPDEFHSQLTILRNLISLQVDAQQKFQDASDHVEVVKKHKLDNEKELNDANARVEELNKKIGELENSHKAMDAHRATMAGINQNQEFEDLASDAGKLAKKENKYSATPTLTGHDQAVAELKNGQAIALQLAQAAKDAAVAHSTALADVLAALKQIQAANTTLSAQLASGQNIQGGQG